MGENLKTKNFISENSSEEILNSSKDMIEYIENNFEFKNYKYREKYLVFLMKKYTKNMVIQSIKK